jgi:hypothetical protein
MIGGSTVLSGNKISLQEEPCTRSGVVPVWGCPVAAHKRI